MEYRCPVCKTGILSLDKVMRVEGYAAELKMSCSCSEKFIVSVEINRCTGPIITKTEKKCTEVISHDFTDEVSHDYEG